MAFTYSFTINGEPIQATLGAMAVEKLEEPLDEGAVNIPITVLRKEKKMLGLLEIVVKDDKTSSEKKFSFLIISDRVTVASKDLFFTHELTAIEYTHKLDKYLINTLTFTRPFPVKRKAPFKYLRADLVELADLLPEIMPTVYVNERYFADQDIVFEQVGFVKVNGGNNTTDYEIDAYIGNDISAFGTKQNITQSDVTFNIPYNEEVKSKKGIVTFYLGYYPENIIIEENFVKTHEFYVELTQERRYTLYDMLMRVRAVVPIETENYFDMTRIFDLDETLIERFKKIEMPQMFIQKQTVRQVLNTLFKYINSISRLKHIGFEERDVLSIDEFNLVTGTFDETELTEFETEQNTELYGSKAISWLEQSLQDNFRNNPSIKTPAQDRFKTVRAKNVQLVANDFNIKLEKPIYELTKFEVFFNEVLIFTSGPLDNIVEYKQDFVLDFTERAIEKSFFDIKNITVDFPNYNILDSFSENVGMRLNRGGHIFWERNKNTIDASLIIGNFLQNTYWITAIKEGLNEYLTLNPITQLATDDFIIFKKQFIEPQISGFSESELYRNIGFNIEYITFDEPTLQSDRADVSDNIYYSEIRTNQQARQLDFGLASRNAYGQLQRGGVPHQTFNKVHTTLDDLLDLGAIDQNGFIITQRAIKFYPEHLEVTYDATKDHNRLAEFIGIAQDYRVFEVPRGNNIYDRRDLYGDYIMIVPPDTNIPELPTMIRDVEKFFRRIYKREESPTKLTFGLIRTDGFLQNYPDEVAPTLRHAIMTPINTYGGKGALQFNFSFPNNLVVGDALNLVNTNFYNEPILYTDRQGFFDTLEFGFADKYVETDSFGNIFNPNEIVANREHKYPLVKSDESEFGQDFTIYSDSPLVIHKDASSTYGLTYQVSILPLDHRQYVIGQAFYTDNRSVKNADFDEQGNDISSKMLLYKYKASATHIDYTYRLFDDLLVKDEGFEGEFGDYEIVELEEGVNVVYDDATQSVLFSGNAEITSAYKVWAIANEQGELYMACNEAINGFRANRRHIRFGMLEIGRLKSLFDRFITTTSKAGFTSTYQANQTSNHTFSVGMNYLVTSVEGKDFSVGFENGLEINAIFEGKRFGSNQYTADIKNIVTSFEGKDLTIGSDETLEMKASFEAKIHQGIEFNKNILYDVDLQEGKDLTITSDLEYELLPTIDAKITGGIVFTGDIKHETSGTYTTLKWVEGGSSPVGADECLILDDVGNVKCDVTQECQFSPTSSYLSFSDDSTSQPKCEVGIEYTDCTWTGSGWLCTIYEGDNVNVYTNCRTCTASEEDL